MKNKHLVVALLGGLSLLFCGTALGTAPVPASKGEGHTTPPLDDEWEKVSSSDVQDESHATQFSNDEWEKVSVDESHDPGSDRTSNAEQTAPTPPRNLGEDFVRQLTPEEASALQKNFLFGKKDGVSRPQEDLLTKNLTDEARVHSEKINKILAMPEEKRSRAFQSERKRHHSSLETIARKLPPTHPLRITIGQTWIDSKAKYKRLGLPSLELPSPHLSVRKPQQHSTHHSPSLEHLLH